MLGATRVAFVKQATRLFTSLRINSAHRDDAGTAASEKLRNPVRGLNLAQRNAQDGVRPIQTAGADAPRPMASSPACVNSLLSRPTTRLPRVIVHHYQAEFTALDREADRI